jgi:hypothetical protein
MRRLLTSLGSTPPPLDHDTVDRLLAVRLDSADAPPGYAAVARLLAAAAAPPRADELAGEEAAVAAFMAITRSRPLATRSRRAGAPGRRFSARAVAVAMAAVLTVGGVAAAATGLLPEPGRRAAHEEPASTTHGSAPGGEPGRDEPGAARDGRAGVPGSSTGGREAATGPDAAGAARDGLCRAWLAGEGGKGAREDSPAFQALAEAAGGAANVPAYCRASTTPPADPGQGQGQPGSPPSTQPSPPDGGNRQGAPPTTDRPPRP